MSKLVVAEFVSLDGVMQAPGGPDEDRLQELVTCIRLNLDCADVCETTGKLMTRQTGGASVEVLRRALETCIAACQACAEECEKHAARQEHCRVCAEACRACEQACRDVVRSV